MSATHRRRMFLIDIDPHCFYCNVPLDETNSTIDHVVPRSKGGGNLNNVVLACGDCNNKKGANDPVSLNVDFARVERINQTLKQMQRLASRTLSKKNQKKAERIKQAIAAMIGNIRGA